MPNFKVITPAGYITPHALAYTDANGTAQIVSQTQPLPINAVGTLPVQVVASTTAALAGTATVSKTVGPYTPLVGRSVMLSLSGTWSGSVSLVRSTDGGATMLPVTIGGAPWAVFSVNCCEPVWDESDATSLLYLQIVVTAGSVTYRLAQ